MRRYSGVLTFVFLAGVFAAAGAVAVMFFMMADARPQPQMIALQAQNLTPSPTVTETIPPYTPLPSLTPSQTLLPPPTFEPPTVTPMPSMTPTTTPTPIYQASVSIPGLHGAETATPSSTPGCEPRKDWKLTYTVQADDALAKIAEKYGTYTGVLAEGNCIVDPNVITIGQILRVPGESQPEEPEYVCTPWEVLTPFDGMFNVPADGTITFNWRGPISPKYLIRITRPDGSQYEQVVELRTNDTVNLTENLREEGTYTWYVYPLNEYFAQIPCLEGGPWTFNKPASTPITTGPIIGG